MSSPRSNSSEDEPSRAKETEAFDRLTSCVKRWVWNQDWEELRPIQEKAIPIILEEDRDVILSSPTASGKTEAAFLPIFSKLRDSPKEGSGSAGDSFQVLYISPLKALINDQFERLKSLSEACDIPIHRRHGDVSSSKKRQAMDDPAGVLLITPESVEALLLHRGPEMHRVLAGIRYIVVDELHSFIGTPRGRQLQSLLRRIEIAADRRIPRIALSATFGDPELAADFLRPSDGNETAVLTSDARKQELKLLVKGYTLRRSDSNGDSETDADTPSGTTVDIAEHLFETLRGQDNLIFANRRAEVELYADLLGRISEKESVPNEFHPHHGSLSKEIREHAELELKDGNRPASVVCTNTLELGIDIGWMESIAQIGCPPSVASMRQRLGRSGRKGNPAILRVYVQEPELTPETPPQDQLRPELVQTIALVNLLLENWFEPPNLEALELSTLVQQLLSLIAESGGVQAEEAYQALCASGPFNGVSPAQFKDLLYSLADHELIDQAGDGDLVMGLEGERLSSHYDFYAAFWTPEEYRLVAGEKTLGSLPVNRPLIEGQLLIFGGQRWQIQEVRQSERVVFLEPAKGGRVPTFGGEGFGVEDRVREEMLNVYLDDTVPVYLDQGAEELLVEGRTHFHRFGLDERSILSSGEDSLLFVWKGDRVINTIAVLLAAQGIQVSKSGMTLEVQNTGSSKLASHLDAIESEGAYDAHTLVNQVQNKIIDKHDRFLSEELLNVNYASKQLDIHGAIDTLRGLGNLGE